MKNVSINLLLVEFIFLIGYVVKRGRKNSKKYKKFLIHLSSKCLLKVLNLRKFPFSILIYIKTFKIHKYLNKTLKNSHYPKIYDQTSSITSWQRSSLTPWWSLRSIMRKLLLNVIIIFITITLLPKILFI